MNTKQKIQLALDLANKGVFGTPDMPRRGASGRCHFWDAYNGLIKASAYKGTTAYPYARAGELYR